MANSPRPFGVTYAVSATNLGLFSGEALSALALIYDEVWFPYPYDMDPSAIQLLTLNPPLEAVALPGHPVYLPRQYYERFRAKYKPLFDTGVFRLLEAPIARVTGSAQFERILEELKARCGYFVNNKITIMDLLDELPIAVYALYSKKVQPEFFVSTSWSAQPRETDTNSLAQALARSFFSYRIPYVQSLTAEQVLEVREHTKDTREGFGYHLFETTDDLEGRIRAGDKFDDAVRKTTERKLLAKYGEFRRQLASKKVGFWSRVLAAGSEFFQNRCRTVDA
jgi:hypothetical protein